MFSLVSTTIFVIQSKCSEYISVVFNTTKTVCTAIYRLHSHSLSVLVHTVLPISSANFSFATNTLCSHPNSCLQSIKRTLGGSKKRQTFFQAIQADFSCTDIEIIAPACSHRNIWLQLRAKIGLNIQQTQHLQAKNWLRVIKSPNLATSQIPHRAVVACLLKSQ